MTSEELQRAQNWGRPLEDLGPYRGRWVAVRDRRIIASAGDPAEFDGNADVLASDALLLVPRREPQVNLL